jgi:hypothetical protein
MNYKEEEKIPRKRERVLDSLVAFPTTLCGILNWNLVFIHQRIAMEVCGLTKARQDGAAAKRHGVHHELPWGKTGSPLQSIPNLTSPRPPVHPSARKAL